MDAALGLGGRDALNAVDTRLVFHKTEDLLTGDFDDDFGESTCLRGCRVEVLIFPVALLGVALIHAHHLTGKNRGFVTTCTRADLEQCIAVLGLVTGK